MQLLPLGCVITPDVARCVDPVSHRIVNIMGLITFSVEELLV